MLKNLRSLLAPPVSSDGDQTRRARSVHIISLALIVSGIVASAHNAWTGDWPTVGILVFAEVCMVATLWLNHRGWLESATCLLILSLLATATCLLLTSHAGSRDTALLIYPSVLAAAGLLLERRWFIAITLAAIACAGSVVLAEINGWIVTRYSARTDLRNLADIALILIVTGLAIGLLSGSLRDSLMQARRHAAALREAEERYRALFDRSLDCLYVADLQGRFLDANPAALALLGYGREEIAALSFESLLSPDQLPRAAQARDEIKATGTQQATTEFRLRRKNGEYVEVETKASLVFRDGEPYAIQGIARDITERKRVGEALRESEAKLRAMFESSRDAIGVAKKGVHIYANLSYLKLFGFESNEEIIGTSITDSIAPSHRQEMIQRVQRRAAGEPVAKFYEARGMKVDGTEFDAEFSVSTYELNGEVYALATIRDITERKRAEEQLRRSEERFRSLSNASLEGIMIHEQGLIVDVNPAFARLFGYEQPEELIGKNGFEVLLTPESRARILERFRGRESGPLEVTCVRKDGSPFAAETESQALKYGDRDARIVSCRDISQRKQAEETLSRDRAFREVLTELLARFASDDGTRLDELIHIGLGEIAGFIGAEYALVVQTSTDGTTWSITHEWCAQGVESRMGRFQNIPLASYLWAANKFLAGEAVFVSRMADLPPEAATTRQRWEAGGVRSVLEVPLRGRGGLVQGCFGLMSRSREVHWAPEDIRHLELVSDVIANALERKRAEQALRESQERYRALFERSPDCVFLTDFEGNILDANQAALDVTGYRREDIPTLTLGSLLAEDQFRLASQRIEELRAIGQQKHPMEYRVCHKDGRLVFMESQSSLIYRDGKPIAIQNIARDITERKRAEAELQRLKNYLANIVDSMPTILVGTDMEKVVTQWNRQAELATGIPAAKAIGQPIAGLLPDFSPWIEALRKEIQQRRPASREKLLLVKDGERNFYDLMMYPLVANCIEGAVLRIENVTERMRIQELMVQTEKMISVGGLAAGMAHEINNPLGIISQAAQNIERRVSPDLPVNRKIAEELGVGLETLQAYFQRREIPQFIRDIREASARASRIVANMLQFSRKSEATRQPAALAEVVERTVELAANDYDLKKRYDFRSIEIIREYDSSLPAVPLAAMEMEQVLLNLIKNAAQAMGANPPERKPRIILRLKRSDPYAVVEAEDNGPGMEEAVLRRVFEPFFTTKLPGVGTGLGLSVSYTIVTQNHKGLITVDSTPGQGARFTIRLPLN